MRPTSRSATLCAALTALALLPSCGSSDSAGAPSSTSAVVPTSTIVLTTPAPAPSVRTKNWFDLQVGDCVTEIPAIETGVVASTVVDCATPHQAEVYLLAPLAVNTAIDQVASEKCTKGLVDYTGQPFNGGPFTLTYVIDSNQDRTTNNPTPSTAICFLQTKDGGPLTKSARL
jgi:hypothetical protein